MAAESEVHILKDDEIAILENPDGWVESINSRANQHVAHVRLLEAIGSGLSSLGVPDKETADWVAAFRLRTPGTPFEKTTELARIVENLHMSLQAGLSGEASGFEVLPSTLPEILTLPAGETAVAPVPVAEKPVPVAERPLRKTRQPREPRVSPQPTVTASPETKGQGEALNSLASGYLSNIIGTRAFNSAQFTTADAERITAALLTLNPINSPVTKQVLELRFKNHKPAEIADMAQRTPATVSTTLFHFKSSIPYEIPEAARHFFAAFEAARETPQPTEPLATIPEAPRAPEIEVGLGEKLLKAARQPESTSRSNWLKDVRSMFDGLSDLTLPERVALFTRIHFDTDGGGEHLKKTNETLTALNKLQGKFAAKGPDWLTDQPDMRTILKMTVLDLMSTNTLDVIYAQMHDRYPTLTKDTTERLLAAGIYLLTKED